MRDCVGGVPDALCWVPSFLRELTAECIFTGRMENGYTQLTVLYRETHSQLVLSREGGCEFLQRKHLDGEVEKEILA